ncbi:hypothetical protein JCM8547_000171 [Rhodosporidiobolus lusitaniae]
MESGTEIVDGKFWVLQHDEEAHKEAEYGGGMEVEGEGDRGVGTSKGVGLKQDPPLKKRTASPPALPSKKKKKTVLLPNSNHEDVDFKQESVDRQCSALEQNKQVHQEAEYGGGVEVEGEWDRGVGTSKGVKVEPNPSAKKRAAASSARPSKKKKRTAMPPSNDGNNSESSIKFARVSVPPAKPGPPVTPARPRTTTTTPRTSRVPSSVKPQLPRPVPQPASSPSPEYTAYVAALLPSIFADEAPSLTMLLFERGIKSLDKFKWYIASVEEGVKKAMTALRNDDRRDEALLLELEEGMLAAASGVVKEE